MFVFLSYAEEDREVAAEISAWLGEHDVGRFDWLANTSNRFLTEIEGAISRADAFIALLSPHFMRSTWCLQERDIAMLREQALRESDSGRVFIHVLNLTGMRPSDAGHLGTYSSLDFSKPLERARSFGELARWLGLGQEAKPPPPPPPPPDAETAGEPPVRYGPCPGPTPAVPAFLNREDELDEVLMGLATTGDRPFWLITSPPQLGKTWFLTQLRARLSAPGKDWVTSAIDLRDVPRSMRQDAGALLATFFGRDEPVPDDPAVLEDVALKIIVSGRPFLCLLDHAELLERPVVTEFRSRLSQIHTKVGEGNRRGVRLGLVVAGRRDTGWQGVTPSPRFSKRPLSEFQPEVIKSALVKLATKMDTDDYTQAKAQTHTNLIHDLTQGLPALLAIYLEWIQDKYWLGIEQLGQQPLFHQLAGPYIENELLTRDSLIPRAAENLARGTSLSKTLTAVRQAYRVLAPFRLFTRSHLQYYIESDPDFRAAVTALDWSAEDLWAVVSDSALLSRIIELWKEIHPAVRRLLHRYYYSSDESCTTAHSEARKFVEVWASQQNGKEQVTCLIECLWHEAMALRTRPATDIQQQLLESAGKLSGQLRDSPAYKADDLRAYAAEKMGEDAELLRLVDHSRGLFDRLVQVVLDPPQETRSER